MLNFCQRKEAKITAVYVKLLPDVACEKLLEAVNV